MTTSKPRIPPIITPIAEGDATANSIWYRFFNSLLEYIYNGFPDAPNDGLQYGRQNLSWTQVNSFVDAPADNLYYGRVNNQWGAVTEEAPQDGRTYARREGLWINAPLSTPGLPQYSIQYNDPVGTFAGSVEYTIDTTTQRLYLGDQNDWMLSPTDRTDTNGFGRDFTIRAGAGSGTARGGDMYVKSGVQGPTAVVSNVLWLMGSDATNSVTQGDQVAIRGGTGGSAALGGQVTMSGGSGFGGGDASVQGGGGIASGGNASLIAGSANTGGFASITGGAAAVQPAGGSVQISGGIGTVKKGPVNIAAGELQLDGDAGVAGKFLASQGNNPPVWLDGLSVADVLALFDTILSDDNGDLMTDDNGNALTEDAP